MRGNRDRVVDRELVENMRAIPVNLRGFPLAGNMMGVPAKAFSDWFENHTMAYMAHENPTSGPHLYNQDKTIFQEEFFDALTDTQMSEIVQIFGEQYGNAAQWLLDKFESEITDAQFFEMQITKTDRDPWPIATLKTQPEVISFEMSSISGTSTFTQQAIIIDRYFMMVSEKQTVANALLASLYGNLSAFVTHLAVMTFHRVNSYFSTPERLFAFSNKPLTVLDVAANEQRTFGRLNKSEFGLSDLKAYAGQVFNQVGYTLTEFFVSRSDAYFMSMFNDVLVSFSKTGEGALANRETITLPGEIGGVKISALPYIETTVHNNTDEQLLNSPVAVGTLAQFRDKTRDNPSSQFRSYMRDIEYCGWDINDFARYEFIHFLEACPSFASTTTDKITEGYVDTDLLERLAGDIHRELGGGKRGVYSRTGTRLAGNEHEADPLLRFIPYAKLQEYNLDQTKDHRYGALFPCVLVGQLPELASVRSQYFNQIYEQMHAKLFGGMNQSERDEVTSALNKGAPSVDVKLKAARSTGIFKLKRNIRKLTHRHPVMLNAIFTYEKGVESKTSGKTMDEFATHLNRFLDLYKGLNFDTENAASGGSLAKYEKIIDASKELPEETKKIMKMLLKYPAYVAEYGTSSKLSAFGERLEKSKNMPTDMRLAILLVLLQPICLQVYNKWHENDINLPHGGKNFRFRERQMMHSIIATAAQGGKLGVYKHSGWEPFTTYQGEIKDFKIQVEGGACFMMPDNKKMFWIPFVRGGPIISGCGGKGSRYFNQRQRVEKPSMDGTLIQQQMDYGQSNFAVLGSLNEAIECKEDAVLSVRGFWTRGEFPTRLHESIDFSRDRPRPMFSGQMLFNLINEFTYDPSDDAFVIEKLNQLEVVSRRMLNYACHQGSIKMWIPSDPEFITRSEHPWGPQMPGLRDLEQSLTRVRQEKLSEAGEIRKRLRKE